MPWDQLQNYCFFALVFWCGYYLVSFQFLHELRHLVINPFATPRKRQQIILPLGPDGPVAPVFPVGPAGPGGPAGPTRTFPRVLWPCWPEIHQERMNAKHTALFDWVNLLTAPNSWLLIISKTILLSYKYLSFFNLCETTAFTCF